MNGCDVMGVSVKEVKCQFNVNTEKTEGQLGKRHHKNATTIIMLIDEYSKTINSKL